jgi:hypothetical protein
MAHGYDEGQQSQIKITAWRAMCPSFEPLAMRDSNERRKGGEKKKKEAEKKNHRFVSRARSFVTRTRSARRGGLAVWGRRALFEGGHTRRMHTHTHTERERERERERAGERELDKSGRRRGRAGRGEEAAK